MVKYGHLVALLAAVCWGYVYAQTENILEKMSPIASLSTFYVIGGILLFPLFILNKKEIFTTALTSPGSLFSTALIIMAAEFLIIWSISLLGGYEAAFMEISYPLWTVIFSVIILGLTPNIQTIFGGLLIMIGSYIISKFSGN
jgi:drug/metabolite transporter (DMT)-like permease